MSKEKQIEEMAELERLLRIRRMDIEKQGCDIFALIKNNTSEEQAIADYLIGKGYRKASEVAEEIFEEIDRAFFKYYDSAVTYSSPNLPYHIREAVGFSLNEMFMKVAELKNKYTENKGE